MYDRRFFASSLGRSALLSIAAMISFAVFAGTQAGPASAHDGAQALPLVVVLA